MTTDAQNGRLDHPATQEVECLVESPMLIAPDLSSRRLTEVLFAVLRSYNPEVHRAVWAIGTFGGGSFALERTQGGQLDAIEELKGCYDTGDLGELETSGYIAVHKRGDGQVAFRPTLKALGLLKAAEDTRGVAINKIVPLPVAVPIEARAIETGDTPARAEVIGAMIHQYRIEQRIGSGGMGEVFRAYDTKLERDVAIKVIHHSLARDAEARVNRPGNLGGSIS